MKRIKAGDMMSMTVVSVEPTQPVSEVIRLFQEKKISAIPVVDAEQKLQGIISKSDVISHAYSWGSQMVTDTQASSGSTRPEEQWSLVLVRDVMHPMLITATPDAPPSHLARIMKDNDIHHVPITDEGKLVGIVSSLDLLKLLMPE